jgi:hypothetical protein
LVVESTTLSVSGRAESHLPVDARGYGGVEAGWIAA